MKSATLERPARPARLDVRRLPLADSGRLPAATSLGMLGYGITESDHAGAIVDAVPGRLLWPAEPQVDSWLAGDAPVRNGTQGQVRWRENGTWLYGAAEFDESADTADLAELTRRIYADAFATLDNCGFPHLLRLWNYLPGINAADGGGMERYRQFNIGRQQAFVDAGRTVLDGAPAACALGAPAGAYRLRFLAARTAPLPVENPRQVSAYRYPAQYGPRSPTFSRAALADAGDARIALLVSGTASIVGHTTVHVGDVVAQARETLANLQALVDAASAASTGSFALKDLQAVAYVRHPADWPLVQQVLQPVLAPGLVALQADVCRSDLLVEVEAHAVVPGRLHAPSETPCT